MASNGRCFDIRPKVSVEHPNSIEVSLVQLIENGIEDVVYKYNTQTDDDQKHCISALVSDDILITEMFKDDDETQSQSLLQCHDLKLKKILWAKRIFVTDHLKIIGNGLLIGRYLLDLKSGQELFILNDPLDAFSSIFHATEKFVIVDKVPILIMSRDSKQVVHQFFGNDKGIFHILCNFGS